MTPRLSVVIPTFNRRHWLGAAMDSVLAPGLDCELIVLDNGSTDGTWALLEDRARLDPRIRPVRWERNNAGAAYPALLEMARGEYVNFFADDDEMLPGGLARKIAVLDARPGIGVVFSTVRAFEREGQDLGEAAWTRLAETDLLDGQDLFQPLMLGNFVAMPAAMFRRALAPTGAIMANPRFIPSSDWQFWLDLARRTRFAYLREPTVRLRMHPDQVTVTHGVQGGYFSEVNLRIWAYWMLEAVPPFIPSVQQWEMMVRNMAGALMASHGNDQAKVTAGLMRLLALRTEQEALLDRTAEVLPEAFWFEPDWTGSGWVEILLSYLEAFAPGEPVALVLHLDPQRPGPSLAAAQDAVVDIALRSGREQIPDVILCEGPQDLLETFRRYPHIQFVQDRGLPGPPLEGPFGARFGLARRAMALKEGA